MRAVARAWDSVISDVAGAVRDLSRLLRRIDSTQQIEASSNGRGQSEDQTFSFHCENCDSAKCTLVSQFEGRRRRRNDWGRASPANVTQSESSESTTDGKGISCKSATSGNTSSEEVIASLMNSALWGCSPMRARHSSSGLKMNNQYDYCRHQPHSSSQTPEKSEKNFSKSDANEKSNVGKMSGEEADADADVTSRNTRKSVPPACCSTCICNSQNQLHSISDAARSGTHSCATQMHHLVAKVGPEIRYSLVDLSTANLSNFEASASRHDVSMTSSMLTNEDCDDAPDSNRKESGIYSADSDALSSCCSRSTNADVEGDVMRRRNNAEELRQKCYAPVSMLQRSSQGGRGGVKPAFESYCGIYERELDKTLEDDVWEEKADRVFSLEEANCELLWHCREESILFKLSFPCNSQIICSSCDVDAYGNVGDSNRHFDNVSEASIASSSCSSLDFSEDDMEGSSDLNSCWDDDEFKSLLCQRIADKYFSRN